MIAVHHRCKNYDSYRAERVKSLFNAEGHGERFDLELDADLDSQTWNIGAIIGPSGSGKTSIARELWGGSINLSAGWPADAPIIDAILPGKKETQ